MQDEETPYQRKMLQLYESLGRFVVAFENCCEALRSSIIFLLQHNGLQNQKLAQSVVNEMGADDMRRALVSIYAHAFTLNEEEQKYLKAISAQFQELTKVRNDIVHAFWVTGNNIFQHEPTFLRFRSRLTGKGL